jgi:hypothetical protein
MEISGYPLCACFGNDAQLDVSPQELTEKALWLATAEADDFPAIKAHLVAWIEGHLIGPAGQ